MFDNLQAYKEGWALFNDGDIQRLDCPSETGIEGLSDDPVFPTDEYAQLYVYLKAFHGSEYHREAWKLFQKHKTADETKWTKKLLLL